MCDCYWQTCNHKGCKVEIPIHITDFALEREVVFAYCKKHEPKNKIRVKYTCTDKGRKDKKNPYIKQGAVYFFTYSDEILFPIKRKSLLNDETRKKLKLPEYDEYDLKIASPNDSGEWKEEVIVPKK